MRALRAVAARNGLFRNASFGKDLFRQNREIRTQGIPTRSFPNTVFLGRLIKTGTERNFSCHNLPIHGNILVRFPVSHQKTDVRQRPVIQSLRCMSREKDNGMDRPGVSKLSEKPELDTKTSSFDPKEHLQQKISETPIVAQMNQRIQRVVHDLNLGDQLSVVAIVTLLGLILTAPYVVRQMKNSENDLEDLVTTDDPVDDFTKLVRQEWGVEERENAVEYMLKDVLQSRALKEAAQSFVVQIFESPEVQSALNRLVKALWTQLVSDPETIKQVVHILQIAIQDEKVRIAAQKLLIELTQEPEVKLSLLKLLQELGRDETVTETVQALITNSAHRSLNDPEVLEHTMEFASDIVGDDVVQQTARDALWNTVGDAVRPATSILFTAAGVGLVAFGIVAMGYARSSESEAQLFETAARSLQINTVAGISRVACWPGQQLKALFRSFGAVLVFPLQLLQRQAVALGRWTCDVATSGLARIGMLPGMAAHSIWAYMVAASNRAIGKHRRYFASAAHGYGNYESIWETLSRYLTLLTAKPGHGIHAIWQLLRSQGQIAGETLILQIYSLGESILFTSSKFTYSVLSVLEDFLTVFLKAAHDIGSILDRAFVTAGRGL